MSVRLVPRAADQAAFDAIASELIAGMLRPLPFSSAGRLYYEATVGLPETEPSFMILQSGEPAIIVLCDVVQRRLGRFGQPATWLELWSGQKDKMDEARSHGLGELKRLMTVHSILEAEITGPLPVASGDRLLSGFLALGFEPETAAVASVDLMQPIDVIEKSYRSRFRSHIRWGRANLSIATISGPEATGALDLYRLLHADVAGRVTRGPESWRSTGVLLECKQGRLVLASAEGILVGGLLVLDAGGTAYYASGAYRREMFANPISHALMAEAIAASQIAGRTRFDVGDVLLGRSASEKERNIAHFKRGFGANIRAGMTYRLSSAIEKPAKEKEL